MRTHNIQAVPQASPLVKVIRPCADAPGSMSEAPPIPDLLTRSLLHGQCGQQRVAVY
jgi:hypothetical protein